MIPAWRPILIALIVAGPAISAGCLSSPVLNGTDLVLVVSAPREGGGLTLFAVDQSRFSAGGTAEFEIRYGGVTVYPPGGKGAEFDLEKSGGAVFVPYSLFVVGNGKYDVLVRHDGETAKTQVDINKWVGFVYLHPFDRGSKIVVDVQLSRTTGGLPNDRVLTEGELVLELHYRGQDGTRDKFLSPAIKVVTDSSETFTRIELPRSRFSEGPGYYSVEPVFHNRQAKGNYWVPPDPTMQDRNPPWNWIYVRR